MIEGQGAVDDVIRMYLSHKLHSLLEAVVPHVLDVAGLGQPSGARGIDIAGLVCQCAPKCVVWTVNKLKIAQVHTT